MAGIALHKWEEDNKKILEQQLNLCTAVRGTLRNVVQQFFGEEGIYSLDEIDEYVKSEYQIYINKLDFTECQRKYYRGLLDQILVSYFKDKYRELSNEISRYVKEKPKRNKILLMLVESGIQRCSDINYEIRLAFKERLENQGCIKKREYIKEMDRIKLETIRMHNNQNLLRDKKMRFENKKIFLLYHPDYTIAKSFYYVRNKEELVYDFSLEAPLRMKKQIFAMLNYVLSEKHERHDRRERFLIPLKKLYLFCVKNNIEDVELLTLNQIKDFRKTLSLEENIGTKETTYIQIIYNITRYLFLSAENTNWNANIWYLQRFIFKDSRMNPAREIEKITFGQIDINENRQEMKKYMKYQIGVAQRRSLQTVRSEYYDLLEFLKYCDAKNIQVRDINVNGIESYIAYIEDNELQADSYNRKLISIARFLDYIGVNKCTQPIFFHFEYYLKTVYVQHHNRTVPEKTQREILGRLKHLPLHLRLMFLNLWCEGIRICEVCVIKAKMYTWDGQDAWINIYQNKMKKEKNIPIPKELYNLMTEYIERKGIGANDYVFQNKKGGAYDAGTFTIQMKKGLKKAGIDDYVFRAHDFRHTLGTMLNREYQSSIEVIREFLGHNSSDMTKQYIDFVPELLDKKNQEYFSKKENNLALYGKKEGN